MPTPAFRFSQLRKKYGAREVLHGIDLEIAPGEFFGLVGMNGAGKTTLLKCLLDFCGTDGGSIAIGGVAHTETESRRPLAFLPERFMPPYYLNGRDFLKYMLQLQSLPYHEPSALEMLTALDLDAAALDRPVRAYSKGMTQKLGLAACFLARKDIYVLDEPMSGLDPKARALLKAQLSSLRQTGRTLFFSSHALADVEEICDRMAILHQGELRFVGSPAECRAHYGTQTLEQAYLACIA
ncbi:MAG: ABC transporter ATP-binding protein [Rhodoferax sp.]|nr:ABC transporter ATP-binding protein [Rhodoferax sp.]